MDKFEYQAVEDAFRDGTVEQKDAATLQKYLVALTNQVVHNDSVRHREIIRGITINHILMQRHIDGLNNQNRKTECWVIALAVASLIATASQTWFAYVADKCIEEKIMPTASAPHTPAIATSQNALPLAHPANTAPPAKQTKDGAKKP